MLFITLTGVLIAFEAHDRSARQTAERCPRRAARRSRRRSPAPRGSRAIRPIAVAERALPGAFASNVGLPNGPKAVFRILKKFPEDRTPAGRSRVYVDQFSGKVLLVENTRTAPLGTRILNLKRSAHTGDIFGAPTQALYFIVSLGIALQAITGALIWWNGRKRERRRRRERTSQEKQRNGERTETTARAEHPPAARPHRATFATRSARLRCSVSLCDLGDLRLLRCLGRSEIDKPSIDIHAGEPHAQAIADVEARVRSEELAFDRRRLHPNERALVRRAGDDRVEVSPTRDCTTIAAADLRTCRSTLLAASSCFVHWVAICSSSSSPYGDGCDGERGFDQPLRHEIGKAPVRRRRVRVVAHRETEMSRRLRARRIDDVLAASRAAG